MDLSILKMKSMLITTKSYLNTVIITMMDLLILVKSTNVLSIVKMNGELNTAQKDIHPSIVIAHSMLKPVKENGLVMTSITSLLNT